MKFDVIIIGGGIAGLTSAYFLAKSGATVCVVDSGDGVVKTASTQMAQGGIAADKDWKLHFEDTMKAGENQSNPKIVEIFCKEAWQGIEWLQKEIQVEFREEPTLEGGHSKHRVWTTGDDTGFQIYRKLFEKCKQEKNILWKHQSRVESVYKKDQEFYCHTEPVEVFKKEKESLRQAQTDTLMSPFVILATGGIGGLFQYSTNPSALTGSGLLFAHRLGAKLENLDVIQFHPTGLKTFKVLEPLKVNREPVFLLTEALRGEGALLYNEKGERFMNDFPRKELSTRKEVVLEMLKQKEVFLDLRIHPQAFWESHFPNICKKLKEEGYNIQKDLIPVVPVEHFLCGGIQVNEYSQTSVLGLFAVGECASTGLHGSNRLASNSLSEAVVFGKRAAEKITSDKLMTNEYAIPVEAGIQDKQMISFPHAASEDLQKIQAVMQAYFRPDFKDKVGLQKALKNIPESFERETAMLFTV